MADQKNWGVEWIYLMNHDVYSRVCKYSPKTGEFKELLRSELGDEIEFWKGFYININSDILGIYATEKGPTLFWNEEQFYLEKGTFEFKLNEVDSETNLFTMVYHGQEELAIEYEKIDEYDYDNWSDEEMTDFFLWLYNNQNVEGFYCL